MSATTGLPDSVLSEFKSNLDWKTESVGWSEVWPSVNLVYNGWNASVDYATGAYGDMYFFLRKLVNQFDPIDLSSIPTIDFNPATIPTGANLSDIDTTGLPSKPNVSYSVESAPSKPELNTVAPPSIGAAPSFNANFPTIELPNTPSPFTETAPSKTVEYQAPDMPDAPVLEIPTAPTLRTLRLPDAPSVNLPTFDKDAPTENLSAPNSVITFDEEMYSSSMTTKVQDKLLYDLENGTGGLPTFVEQALWDRDRDRQQSLTETEKLVAITEFASRGFSLPAGSLDSRLQQITRDGHAKLSESSRERAIEQAKRAYEHLQFVLKTAVEQESQLMSYANSVAQRAFEVQRAAFDMTVSVFNAKVNLYNARTQAYQIEASVFKERVAAELTKIELFRAQLEGQKLIGELNLQDLGAYKTAIASIEAIAQVYKTEVEAQTAKADVQKIGLQAYGLEIEAYKSKAQAKAIEFDSFSNAVNAELAKVRLFEGEVNAFNSQVNAYSSLVNAESAKSRVGIENNQAILSRYASELEGYKAAIDAESSRVSAELKAFDSEVNAYNANLDAQRAKVSAEVSEYEANVRAAATRAELQLKEAEYNMSRSKDLLGLYTDALTSGANLSGSLVQAAWSAVNLSSSISGDDAVRIAWDKL